MGPNALPARLDRNPPVEYSPASCTYFSSKPLSAGLLGAGNLFIPPVPRGGYAGYESFALQLLYNPRHSGVSDPLYLLEVVLMYIGFSRLLQQTHRSEHAQLHSGKSHSARLLVHFLAESAAYYRYFETERQRTRFHNALLRIGNTLPTMFRRITMSSKRTDFRSFCTMLFAAFVI